MVGTDLQRLITTHQKADLVGLLVLQESNVTSSTLLPFFGLTIVTEKLSTALNLR